jgi:hypothetical protein
LRQEGVKTPKINNGKSLTSSSDLLYARNIASASRSFSLANLVSRCLDTKAFCTKKYILVAGKGQNPFTMKTTVIALAFLDWELIPHSSGLVTESA